MRKEDLIKGLQGLKTIDAREWKQAVDTFPTCEIILWNYLRELYRNDDISFENELLRLGLRLSNKEIFYRFMTQQNVDLAFPELAATTGDWFEKEDNLNNSSKDSLLELARKLKASRLAEKEKREAVKEITKAEKETIHNVTEPDTRVILLNNALDEHDKELKIKNLISNKKYYEALEILRSINLNESKKSATFAVQIKWLETIINYK